jgi:hypothetical protein
MAPAPAGRLNPSGTPEADAHFAAVHQHRHLAATPGEPQHLFQGLGIFLDIPENYDATFLPLGLPGPAGEGSGFLAEDGDFLGHLPPPHCGFM